MRKRLVGFGFLLFFFFFISGILLAHGIVLWIAYYVAFGPHGPRAPVSPPGQGLKVFLATMGLVGVAGVITLAIRALGAWSPSIFPWVPCILSLPTIV